MVWVYDNAAQTIVCYLNGALTTLGTGGTEDDVVTGGTGVPMRIGNSAYSGAANEWDKPIYKVALYEAAFNQGQVIELSHDPYGPYRRVASTVGLVPAAVSLTIPIASYHYQQMAR